MTTKYGDFQPPQFNTVGDKFTDRAKPGERDLGLAFKATVAKRGKNNDATFDKVKVLYEGEKYVDTSRQALLANAEKKKGMLSETPFKMSSPMKESAGLGDFYGTLQGKLEYIAGNPDVKRKKGDFVGEKTNLYTSPGKKGSYGTTRTTLSERKALGGMQGEYSYQAEPYERHRQMAAAEKKAARNVSESPFVPANPGKKGSYGYSKTNVGNRASGVAGEYAYAPHGGGGGGAGGQPSTTAKIETPFVPAHVPRKGYNCTLTKFPVYYADPDQLKADARRQARKLEHAALASGSPFRPTNIPKMAATRSIVRMNL